MKWFLSRGQTRCSFVACAYCKRERVNDSSDSGMENKMGQYAHSRSSGPCSVCVFVCVVACVFVCGWIIDHSPAGRGRCVCVCVYICLCHIIDWMILWPTACGARIKKHKPVSALYYWSWNEIAITLLLFMLLVLCFMVEICSFFFITN